MGFVLAIDVVDPDAWRVRVDAHFAEYPDAFGAKESGLTETFEARLAEGAYLAFLTSVTAEGKVEPYEPPALQYMLKSLPHDGRFSATYIADVDEKRLQTLPGRTVDKDWVVGDLTPDQLRDLLRPKPNPYLEWSETTASLTRLPR
jgi:hypothetical protein